MDVSIPVSVEEALAYLEHLSESFSSESDIDETFFQYGLARYVLDRKLGRRWLEQHLRTPAAEGGYFDPAEGTVFEVFEHQARVGYLADVLLNLQNIPAATARFERLANDERNLESSIGELEGAVFLYRAGFKFEFVQETGQRGRDFDVRILLPNGSAINCEMKCKLRSTALTMNTIKRSLDDARSQLPSQEPGLIFVRIPGRWTSEPSMLPIIDRTIRRFFGNKVVCTHIIGIVFHWERWFAVERRPGAAARAHLFRPIANTNSRFRDVGAEVLGGLKQNAVYGIAEPLNWTTTAEFVHRHLS